MCLSVSVIISLPFLPTAAAHMIAAIPPRPTQQPLQQTLQQPAAVGMVHQAPPTMTSMAVNTSLSQTLAAQQQAQGK